jgi:uncharacterized protein (TIGR02145 family)
MNIITRHIGLMFYWFNIKDLGGFSESEFKSILEKVENEYSILPKSYHDITIKWAQLMDKLGKAGINIRFVDMGTLFINEAFKQNLFSDIKVELEQALSELNELHNKSDEEIGTILIYNRIVQVAASDSSKLDQSLTELVDPRDGHQYKVVKIDDQVMMAENLRYKMTTGCWAYDNNEETAKRFGYLYDWESAKEAAKGIPGWHLPSLEEWQKLYDFLGGDPKRVYSALRVGGSSGFNARGGGYRKSDGEFTFLNDYDHIWSSTPTDEEGRAWYFNCFTSFLSNGNTSDLGSGFGKAGFSVRLFKD